MKPTASRCCAAPVKIKADSSYAKSAYANVGGSVHTARRIQAADQQSQTSPH